MGALVPWEVATRTLAAPGPSGTRAIRYVSAAISTLASTSPKITRGRALLLAAKPLPWMAISPPGIAAAGAMLSTRGVESLGNACDLFSAAKFGETFAHRPQQRRILLTRERTAPALSRVCHWRRYVHGRYVLGPYVLG